MTAEYENVRSAFFASACAEPPPNRQGVNSRQKAQNAQKTDSSFLRLLRLFAASRIARREPYHGLVAASASEWNSRPSPCND